jgi:hypothetical protein
LSSRQCEPSSAPTCTLPGQLERDSRRYIWTIKAIRTTIDSDWVGMGGTIFASTQCGRNDPTTQVVHDMLLTGFRTSGVPTGLISRLQRELCPSFAYSRILYEQRQKIRDAARNNDCIAWRSRCSNDRSSVAASPLRQAFSMYSSVGFVRPQKNTRVPMASATV